MRVSQGTYDIHESTGRQPKRVSWKVQVTKRNTFALLSPVSEWILDLLDDQESSVSPFQTRLDLVYSAWME